MANEIPTTEILMTSLTPTPIERAMGRFMRAPDHDAAGEPPAAAPADGDADAGTSGDAAQADAAQADDAGEGDGDNGSLMGEAGKAEPDAGDGGEGEGQGGEGQAKDPDGGEPDTVPETYDLALPEGVEMDAALLDEATPVLKELGLTNDAANKLIPLVGKVQESILTRQADAHSAMAADWAKTAKADPEIGGRNWDATMTNVARALDHFGAPSAKDADGKETNPFRQLLNDTKLGNHPEMIRMFAKAGAAIGEDSDFVPAGAIPATKLPREAILYPNDLPKTK